VKVHVLALDFDGTIAIDGVLDDSVRDAVRTARARGITVLLVTGRIRADLERLLCDLALFDAVVAENGACVFFPQSGRSVALGRSPPLAFTQELCRRDIPFLAGECVVDLHADHASAVLSVIRILELPLVLQFNRDRLMVLPQAISKATGLREALRALRLSPHNAIAFGDAENDYELLRACELGIAVAWGSDALTAAADEVLPGDGPPAVARRILEIADDPRFAQNHQGRRLVHLGIREGGGSLTLPVRGRNVLVTGDTRSGKSWVTGLLCEQLVLEHYCVCIVDPEGEYAGMETLPSVVVFDADPVPPGLDDVERTLRYPDVSAVLDLSHLDHKEKTSYAKTLLKRLRGLRARTGLPHRIVVDEAHYFLHDPDVTELFDWSLSGYTLVTYRASQLHGAVLDAMQSIIVTRASDPAEAEALRGRFGRETDPQDWTEILPNLETDEAALLPGSAESGDRLVRFKVSRRLTEHVRHERKYVSVPLPPQSSFVFMRDGTATGDRACSLGEFVAILEEEPTFGDHIRDHDVSRWVRDVFVDGVLADRIREIEDEWIGGRIDAVHEAIAGAVRMRYHEAAGELPAAS